MIKQKISKKRLLAYTTVTAVLVVLAGIFFFDLNKGLALEKLSENINQRDIDWAGEEQTFFNYRADVTPEPIDGLPTDAPIYFTNTHLTSEYQYAQTANENSWAESQRLFWRKDSTEEWQEIELTDEDMYPSNFISYNGRQYLAAIGGKAREKNYLYFIDVEEGKLHKQLEANRILISPDSQKILCDDTDEDYMGYHVFHVFDLKDGSKTHITNIQDASPGSGRSFNYSWSKDSNFVDFQGRSSGNREGFYYIYDHGNKKLYSVL